MYVYMRGLKMMIMLEFKTKELNFDVLIMT